MVNIKPQQVNPATYRIILATIFLLSIHLVVQGQVRDAWAVGDGEKIFRNDDKNSARNGNFIWDGKIIRLKGLYNEILGFQIIAEVEKKGAKAIEISVDSPVEKKSGRVIGGSSLKYGTEGTVEVFSEHYLHVSDSTHPNWFYGSAAAAPEKMTGWIPDALIPSDAMPGRGGFPIDVPAVNASDKHFKKSSFQNQGFWVDLHLPRDRKNYPPAVYHGAVKVLEAGKVIKELPLEIELLPFYLEEENATNIWAYNGNIGEYFPGLSQENIDKMIKFEAHRHRINISGGFEVNGSPFNLRSMENYKPYLDGRAFTPANGYNGPGEGKGESLFPVGMYGSNVLGTSKEEVWRESDLWVDWFKKNAPGITYFWYIIDEPTPPVYSLVMEKAGWIKSNPGKGKDMPVFTTSHYIEELAGSIDIWAAYDGVDLKILPGVRARGGDYWFYNGNRPRIGSVILEGDGIDYRVNPWILYKYGINQWFIWETTHWQHNSQGPKGRLHQNIFRNPLTFINNNMEFGNGDGILFYPGRMPFYPDEDRGLNRLIPSIRLKNLRRGQQDAVIMKMAEKSAGKETVLKMINSIVPKAMSEVEMTDKVQWSENSADYDKVRVQLLQLLK